MSSVEKIKDYTEVKPIENKTLWQSEKPADLFPEHPPGVISLEAPKDEGTLWQGPEDKQASARRRFQDRHLRGKAVV